jgi:hypothetical protein
MGKLSSFGPALTPLDLFFCSRKVLYGLPPEGGDPLPVLDAIEAFVECARSPDGASAQLAIVLIMS